MQRHQKNLVPAKYKPITTGSVRRSFLASFISPSISTCILLSNEKI